MAGAKMLTNYPTSIVVHGVALNITVQTYNESLDFGLMACAEAMPEVAEFAAQIETAFEEFKGWCPRPVAKAAAGRAAGEEGAASASRRRRRRAAAKKAAARKASSEACPEGDTHD